jgi:hypothetical protein
LPRVEAAAVYRAGSASGGAVWMFSGTAYFWMPLGPKTASVIRRWAA